MNLSQPRFSDARVDMEYYYYMSPSLASILAPFLSLLPTPSNTAP